MLKIESLSVSYGKREILKDVSFTLDKGEAIAFLGLNGTGKTTLFKAITGIIPSKSIFIDGENIQNFSLIQRAKKIAYLPQERASTEMTVLDTVLLGRYPHLKFPKKYTDKDMEIALNAISDMELTPYTHTPVNKLSGGYRQRTFIAMALTQNTDYFLFDEPLNSLDILSAKQFFEIILRLKELNKGVALILHDVDAAIKNTDKIIVLDNGSVLKEIPSCQAEKNEIFELLLKGEAL